MSKKKKNNCISASSVDLFGEKSCWYEQKSDHSSKGICKKIPCSASIKLGENNTLKYDVLKVFYNKLIVEINIMKTKVLEY